LVPGTHDFAFRAGLFLALGALLATFAGLVTVQAAAHIGKEGHGHPTTPPGEAR
jgi:hypothetical protein